jgi:flavin reductase (DIM6/NTAB) family NADH-FMN oxidoreductase RutF
MDNSAKETISFNPGETPIPKFHHLMLGAIGPRPIALASTIDREGRPNLSPFSFFNAFGANPPIVIFSPARRGKDNTTKHTYENVREVPEVVINAVTYGMVQKVSDSSWDYPKGVNEFEMVGFTMLPSELVKPFRVMESPVQMECKVLQVIETGYSNAAGNLVICEILRMHVDPAILDEKGRIDPQKIDLVGRMGGDFYSRASGSAIFELKKPE